MEQKETPSELVKTRRAQEKRIVLTRSEFIKILSRFTDFVKNKEPKDFPGWLDEIFDEAKRDGAIVFDREAPAGRRFA